MPAEAAALRTPAAGTVLAFDFGERRIGVAVGEIQLAIAHPLETIDTESNDARFERIGGLVKEWKPVLFVVGYPLALDGTEHRLSALAQKFARRLTGRFGIEARLVDERLTSVEAQRDAKQAGLNARAQRQHVDPLAARLILESFFNDNYATS
jgi:putative holliday junction resolvase